MFDTWIVQPIFNLLLTIYNFVGDFGVAIIIFTLIVKFLMWPLAKRQMTQTKLMRKIQPELAEIKKSCKGNRQMESLQMMDLYKRNNVKPFRSILTLLVQLPIFIALFRVINMMSTSGEDISRYAYGWVSDLGRVNELIYNFEQFQPRLFGVIDLNSRALPVESWHSIAIWVVVLAAVFMQYRMAKQQMPSKSGGKKFKDIMKEAAGGKEADQSEINGIISGQMTKILPIMMFFIMIGMPGALAFYFFMSNTVTAIQQNIIFKQKEEEMEVAADKKILKELRDVDKIKEAKVVKNKKSKSSSKVSSKENVTRISASDKKRRK
ncbi:YidC/Oxa1 family membrane protein insertase [Candidatus Saccharibacteria bacterium]|nr:YidC/Oxa1 family membrane protein insertase [Candidatus Saccharibacteria bacterium]